MAIAREDLKELGFKQVGPSEKGTWQHEVWFHDGRGRIWMGYDQEEVVHNRPAIDGDKDSLVKVCKAMLGAAENYIHELERDDDYYDDW